MKSTYQFLFENCHELYQREFLQSDQTVAPPPVEGPNSKESLEFWDRLIVLIVSVIEEDKTCYTGVLNQLVDLYNTMRYNNTIIQCNTIMQCNPTVFEISLLSEFRSLNNLPHNS